MIEVLHGASIPLPHARSPADHHRRDSGRVRLGQSGDGVGDPRACRHGRNRRHAGGKGPSLGHEHRVLLVPGVDEAETFDPATLEQGKDVAPGETEHGLDA
jgi:hypothetical protein